MNGQEAVEHSICWQLRMIVTHADGYWLCGAVIIDAQWALSAAHCFYTGIEITGVLLLSSEHNVLDSGDHDENQAIYVYFDGYDGLANDFAMVFAYQEFDFSRIGRVHITCILAYRVFN